MKPKSLLPLLLFVGVAGLVTWKTVFQGEEARIAKRLDRLAAAFEKKGDESVIVAAARAKQITGFFAEEFQASPGAPFGHIDDKEAFAAAVLGMRRMISRLNIRQVGREIELRGDEAEVGTTLRVTYRGGDGTTGSELREFRIVMLKTDGDWLIRQVELIEGRMD